jgi:hypothetical protein
MIPTESKDKTVKSPFKRGATPSQLNTKKYTDAKAFQSPPPPSKRSLSFTTDMLTDAKKMLGTVDRVVRNRQGAVLARQMILKTDHFPTGKRLLHTSIVLTHVSK